MKRLCILMFILGLFPASRLEAAPEPLHLWSHVLECTGSDMAGYEVELRDFAVACGAELDPLTVDRVVGRLGPGDLRPALRAG